MNKPFTLKVEDSKKEIINIINGAELPAYCIKKILQEIYDEIEKLDKDEIEQYYKNQEKMKGEKENDKD